MKRTRILMALVVLLMLMSPLMAVQLMNVTWQWENNDPEVIQYRYQLENQDPDAWTVVDASVLSYQANGLDPYKDYTLYLQSTYDGENWSEAAAATALAMLSDIPVVEEPVVVESILVEDTPVEEPAVIEEVAPIEAVVVEEVAPIEDAVVEVAPVEDVVIEEVAPIEEAAPVEEIVAEVPAVDEEPAIEPVAEEVPAEAKKNGFKFNLLFNGGVATDVNLNLKENIVSGIFPTVGLGLDFQNIVSFGSFGLGLRSDLYATLMPSEKDWNNLPNNFAGIFNNGLKIWIDSSLDAKIMAYYTGNAVDVYLGAGAGFSLFNPPIADKAIQAELGHSFRNIGIFSSAYFISGNAGLRVKFNDKVSLGAEANYRYLLPAKKHTASANLSFGISF